VIRFAVSASGRKNSAISAWEMKKKNKANKSRGTIIICKFIPGALGVWKKVQTTLSPKITHANLSFIAKTFSGKEAAAAAARRVCVL